LDGVLFLGVLPVAAFFLSPGFFRAVLATAAIVIFLPTRTLPFLGAVFVTFLVGAARAFAAFLATVIAAEIALGFSPRFFANTAARLSMDLFVTALTAAFFFALFVTKGGGFTGLLACLGGVLTCAARKPKILNVRNL
jgi:hypothetical protein|tara:strand:+ start:318 stop:731 length:414 start_codon:yes stop_codon:yes gene_type:complete